METQPGSVASVVRLPSLLLPQATIALLSKQSPSVYESIFSTAEDEGVRLFPDGSVYVAREPTKGRAVEVLWGLFRTHHVFYKCIEPHCCFRSLAGFKSEKYLLLYTKEYQNRLGATTPFIIRPTRFDQSPSDAEYLLSDLEVTVTFRRRIESRVARLFAASLREWSSTVSERGAFRDGPAFVLGEAHFRGPRAHFHVDISRAGQDTLNWLTLSIFRFGHDKFEISRICYDLDGDEHY